MANPNPVISVETQFQEGNQASIKHGIRSLQASGEIPPKLATDDLRAREREIVQNLATLEGIEREYETLCRKAILVVVLGDDWIAKEREKGADFAEMPLLTRYATYLNTAGRLLDKLAALKKDLGKDGVLDYEKILREQDDG